MVFGIDDLIVGGGSILGGALGGIFGGGDKKKAQQLQKDALTKIQNVSLPTIEELQAQLSQLSSQGQLTPELEQSILQQASELENISTDPRLKDAQMAALSKLQGIGQDGLSAENRLALNQTRRATSQDSQARDQAILQNMGARGAGGSGAELAARLSSSQAQADRASQEGDRVAAMANQQALQAIMNAGQLGGQMQGQEFNQASQIAQAQDAINRFNTANRQNVEGVNTAARNQAQMQNLTSAQRIADSNVGLKNQQQLYNKNVIADDYTRRMGKAGAEADAMNSQAKNLLGQAANTGKSWANIGSAAGGIASGIFGGKVAPASGSGTAEPDPDGLDQRMRK